MRLGALLPAIIMIILAGCSTSAGITSEEAAEAYYNLGNAYTELGRNQDAVNAYTRARQLDSELLSAGFNLARVYIFLEKYEKSLEQLDELLVEDPSNRIILETRAWVYHLMGDDSTALAIYEEVLSDFETSRNSLYNSAVLLSENQDLEEALTRFKKLFEYYPDEEEAVFEIASLEAELGNYDSASLWLEKRLEMNPEDIEALELSGDVFTERRMYTEAVDDYRQLVQKAGSAEDESFPEETLGRVYFKIAEILLKYMEDLDNGFEALQNSVGTGWKGQEYYDRLLENSGAEWYSDVLEIIGPDEKKADADGSAPAE